LPSETTLPHATECLAAQIAVCALPETKKTVRANQLLWTVSVGLAAVALCMPFLRAVTWLGDEGVLLDGAQRMLHGDKLYVDLFSGLPPGGYLITEEWFRLFGISMLSARALAILTIAGIACFTFLACRLVCRNSLLPAALSLGWVATSQGYWTQVSHHWFTTCLSMMAGYFALRSAGRAHAWFGWPVLAGIAAGAAGLVTSSRGAFAVIAALSAFADLRRQWRQTLLFVLSVAVMLIGFVVYLLWQHLLPAAFDDVIVFTATRYALIQWVPFGHGLSWENLLLVALFPAVLAGTVLLGVVDWRALAAPRARTCAALSLAGFSSCFPRPDMAHIGFAAPLAFPMLALLMSQISRRWRPVTRYATAGLLFAICIPSFSAFIGTAQSVARASFSTTPRGKVAFSMGRAAEVRELLDAIVAKPRAERFFFYPYLPMLPFISARDQQGQYDLFAPDFTAPVQYQQACVSVIEQATWAVVDTKWADPKILKVIFPGMTNPRPPETARFEAALDKAFPISARFGTFELRRKAPDADPRLCAGIAR